MRFDDSLHTVLAADSSTPTGATLAWRQLVDLIGRGRAPANETTLGRLRAMRRAVPRGVRAASGRALAFAEPPAGLVRLFAEDDPAIAAPVLRTATASAAEWQALLPDLSPGGRSILRHRRDLPPETVQALQAFGPIDFVLPQPEAADSAEGVPVTPAAEPVEPHEPAADCDAVPIATAPLEIPAPEEDFVRVGAVARSIPGLAKLLATRSPAGESTPPEPAAATNESAPPAELPGETSAERFEISDLVARIDAFQRQERPAPLGRAELFDLTAPPARRFRFESDADGVIRWVEGAERAPLIGLHLASAAAFGESGVDGAVAGAFRRRAAFADARLVVTGRSTAGGQWRVSATPGFDPASGRFTGYRGTARRPRRDEIAETPTEPAPRGAESMRQLVHELRTPLNAIAGFAEMIEAELLGPVAGNYRSYATAIRGQADRLLSGIDDLDMAARADSGSLELRPEPIALAPLLRQVAADLRPLADLRGATVAIDAADDLVVLADSRAVERLAGRLLATLVGAAAQGETVHVVATTDERQVIVRYDRPLALGSAAESDAPEHEDTPGVSLLGADFALRLAANLAREQGGELVQSDHALTLRLPAAVIASMEQAQPTPAIR